jgi:hypothetical protein
MKRFAAIFVMAVGLVFGGAIAASADDSARDYVWPQWEVIGETNDTLVAVTIPEDDPYFVYKDGEGNLIEPGKSLYNACQPQTIEAELTSSEVTTAPDAVLEVTLAADESLCVAEPTVIAPVGVTPWQTPDGSSPTEFAVPPDNYYDYAFAGSDVALVSGLYPMSCSEEQVIVAIPKEGVEAPPDVSLSWVIPAIECSLGDDGTDEGDGVVLGPATTVEKPSTPDVLAETGPDDMRLAMMAGAAIFLVGIGIILLSRSQALR